MSRYMSNLVKVLIFRISGDFTQLHTKQNQPYAQIVLTNVAKQYVLLWKFTQIILFYSANSSHIVDFSKILQW